MKWLEGMMKTLTDYNRESTLLIEVSERGAWCC